MRRPLPDNWVDFAQEPPTEFGYYFIRYIHKDGGTYFKGVWWNGKSFNYKDYVVRVEKYLPKRFDFYCPCMMYGEGLADPE